MKRALILVLASGLPAAAAISNARVVTEETTATQALLRYTAPDLAACTVEVSESATFTPLVHDLNPALFPGANRDDRPGSLPYGLQRTFVIGKRAAALAADGRYYSRALQAAATHYYRITCGADTATGSFTTRTLAYGYTRQDALPSDPANPGMYAYPTFDWSPPALAPGNGTLASSGASVTFALPESLAAGDLIYLTSGPQRGEYRSVASVPDSTHAVLNWAFGQNQPAGTSWAKRPANRNSDWSAIDPQTGILVRWITDLQQTYLNDWASSGAARLAAVTAGAGWANATTASLGSIDSSVASFDPAGNCTPSCSWLRLAPSASRSMSTGYSSDDYQLAWVVVGVRGSATGTGEDAKIEVCLTADGASCRSAILELALAAGATLYAGDERPILTAWLDSANVVASRVNRTEFYGASGGVLIRKKTPTGGALSLDYTGLSQGYGGSSPLWFSAGYPVCSEVLVNQTYNGVSRPGYTCQFASGKPLYWLARENADSVVLSPLYGGGSDSGGGWSATTLGAVPSGAAFDPADASVLYGSGPRTGGGLISLKTTYTGNFLDMGQYYGGNPPQNFRTTTSSVTKNDSIEAKLQAFLTGHTPGLVASRWIGSPHPFGGGSLLDDDKQVVCSNPGDFGVGWKATIGLKGASAGNVLAAHSTHSYYPYRFCGLHSCSGRMIGDGWLYMGGNNLIEGTACFYGPFQTELAETMNNAGSGQDVACPSPLPTDITGTVCTRVLVQGDVHKPSTLCSWENTNRGDPPSGFLDLQAARAGDTFLVGSEKVQVVAKAAECSDPNAPCYWTFLRAIQGTTAASHPSGSVVKAFCPRAANWVDVANDPYGEGSYPTAVKFNYPGHSSLRLSSRMLSVTAQVDCHGPYYPCYTQFQGTIPQVHDQVVNHIAPYGMAATTKFAGQQGNPTSTDSHLNYQLRDPSIPQFALDGFPLTGPAYGLPTQTWTYLNGTASLYSTSFTVYKALDLDASCFHKPMVDVTPGPIVDGPAGAYTFCLGDCGRGGGPSTVYANCPDARPDATETCQSSTNDDIREICLFQPSGLAHTYRQILLDRQDGFGGRSRNLGSLFSRYRINNVYTSASMTYDGRWAFVWTRWLDNVLSPVLALKLPPAAADSVNRTSFVPVPLSPGSVPAGTATALAEFGYDPNRFCASRQEVCVAVGTGQVNETNPFYWASETYSRLSCAAGCTVTVPALSQRVLYYRMKFYNTAGALISTGATQVTVTP